MKTKQFDAASTQRLYTAIDNNDVREFQAMTDAGYPVATASFGGEEWKKTTLMMLVDRPDAQLASVKKLIELGSRLDAVDSYNRTPLHIAAGNSDNNPQIQSKIIAYLVRMGANLEVRDNGGEKPIDCAKDSDLFTATIMQAETYRKNMMKAIRGDITRDFLGSKEKKDVVEGVINKAIKQRMEDDAAYERTINEINERMGGNFVDKLAKARAGQTTANPIMASLVANEGGFAGAVLKQQEEKKQQKCCVIT